MSAAIHRLSRIALLTVALHCGAAAPCGAAYHVLRKVVLGGEGGWDCLTVDADARRLYIARSNRVMVVDADSCSVIGEIPNTPGVHGVALVPSLKRGVTSNGGDTSATIFDLGSLKEVARVRTGIRPDIIIYDSASGRVFTMNAGSHDATAIDPAKGIVVGTVSFAGQPEFAVTDGEGDLFVNLEDSSAVEVVDTRSLKTLARWALSPGEGPTGLALDRKHHRLFAGCADSMMVVMDAASGRVITTLPIGGNVDGTGFDPETNLAFSSNGEGTLTVVQEASPDSFFVRENAITQVGARTMALDEKTHRVFLVTAEFGPRPEATVEQPRPRRPMVPGSFVLLVLGE